MTLFVRLADVPSEILELVKARIMANRKRNQKKAVAAPSSKTPRRRYYNPEAADRRPEPGAVFPYSKGWLLVPGDRLLNAKVRGIPPFRFAQGVGLEGDPEPLIVVTSPGSDRRPYIEGAPGSVNSAASSERPLLKKPASGDMTEECFYFISNTDDEELFISRIFVNFSTMHVGCQTIRASTISRVVREVFIEDVNIYPTVTQEGDEGEGGGGGAGLYYASAWDDFDDSFFKGAIRNESFTAYGWHHAAHVVVTVGSSVISSLYLDGSRVLRHDPQPAAAYWATFEAQNQDRIFSEGFNMSAGIPAHRVSGLRYTERALYMGDTYTVPESITRLA